MEPLDQVLLELDALERCLSRRAFLKAAALAPTLPRSVSADDREFLHSIARVVVPAEALASTGIDVVQNAEHLLGRANAHHRARVLRMLRWARRLSFLYGGEQMPLRARRSRFVIVRRLARAVTVVCVASFWADDRAMTLIHLPGDER